MDLDIKETVMEYWPELSRGWKSSAAAVRYYSEKAERLRELQYEVKAADRVRERSRKPEEHRNTGTFNNVDATWDAIAEIKRVGKIATSIEEIQERTMASAIAVTTTKSRAGEGPWSEDSILLHLSPVDFERLRPPELLARPPMPGHLPSGF